MQVWRWGWNVGSTLFFVPLLLKNWRVYYIFHNPTHHKIVSMVNSMHYLAQKSFGSTTVLHACVGATKVFYQVAPFYACPSLTYIPYTFTVQTLIMSLSLRVQSLDNQWTIHRANLHFCIHNYICFPFLHMCVQALQDWKLFLVLAFFLLIDVVLLTVSSVVPETKLTAQFRYVSASRKDCSCTPGMACCIQCLTIIIQIVTIGGILSWNMHL